MHEMTLEKRIELTRAIISLLDDWGLSAVQQVEILGLPSGTRPGLIRQYRQNTPFPIDEQVAERIEHIIGIAEALRTSHPLNSAMDAIWINKANYRLDNRTPLSVMVEDGLRGIISVRAQLDCTFDWSRLAAP